MWKSPVSFFLSLSFASRTFHPGPVDRKMIINGLNSGAMVYMADFEDSNCPTWENNVSGQINLRTPSYVVSAFKPLPSILSGDAILGTITFGEGSKKYQLRADKKCDVLLHNCMDHEFSLLRLATLMVRPRGWHLDEAHVEVDGQPVRFFFF